MIKRIVIVGGGFAGVWAAIGAAAQARRQGAASSTEITLHSPSEHLVIRPRLYERDPSGARVPLRDLLPPVGVRHVHDEVAELTSLHYDQLIICAGSRRGRELRLAGDFGVDTFAQAQALRTALAAHQRPTVAVIGAGFTGIEAAAELAAVADVQLFDSAPQIASAFGPRARAVIEQSLQQLGVELHPGAVTGADGRPAGAGHPRPDLTLWATSMRASPLTEQLGVALDPQGRIFTDRSLQTEVPGIWAAGDVARVTVDGVNDAPMSCQHAMPQGAVAGANAVRAAFGRPLERYAQPMYLTCLDLGAAGALLTAGFGRDDILARGDQAKAFKRWINRSLIYPPASRRPSQLLKLGSAPIPGQRAAQLQLRALRLRLVRRQLTTGAEDRAAIFAARELELA